MPELNLGKVVGPQGPQGVDGPAGAQGVQGVPGEPGKDAAINGYNVLNLFAAGAAQLTQDDKGNAVIAASGKNLLDNWYFVDPIDQSNGYVVPPDTPYYSDTGLTTQVSTVTAYTKAVNADGVYGTITVSGTTYYVDWTAAVRGYVGPGCTIDRWRAANSLTQLITEDGIRLVMTQGRQLRHVFEDLSSFDGRSLTCSALFADGTIATGTIKFDASVTSWDLHTFFTKGNLRVLMATAESCLALHCINSSTGVDETIKAIKLELGSQQTLAHQDADGNWVLNGPPPDKVLELAKCQRYQLVINAKRRSNVYFGMANAYGGNKAFVYVPTPTTMRVVPTCSVLGDVSVRTGTTNYKITGLSGYNVMENAVMLSVFTEEESLTKGNTYILAATDNILGTIILDANL